LNGGTPRADKSEFPIEISELSAYFYHHHTKLNVSFCPAIPMSRRLRPCCAKSHNCPTLPGDPLSYWPSPPTSNLPFRVPLPRDQREKFFILQKRTAFQTEKIKELRAKIKRYEQAIEAKLREQRETQLLERKYPASERFELSKRLARYSAVLPGTKGSLLDATREYFETLEGRVNADEEERERLRNYLSTFWARARPARRIIKIIKRIDLRALFQSVKIRAEFSVELKGIRKIGRMNFSSPKLALCKARARELTEILAIPPPTLSIKRGSKLTVPPSVELRGVADVQQLQVQEIERALRARLRREPLILPSLRPVPKAKTTPRKGNRRVSIPRKVAKPNIQVLLGREKEEFFRAEGEFEATKKALELAPLMEKLEKLKAIKDDEEKKVEQLKKNHAFETSVMNGRMKVLNQRKARLMSACK
jgi:hypothetical protein